MVYLHTPKTIEIAGAHTGTDTDTLTRTELHYKMNEESNEKKGKNRKTVSRNAFKQYFPVR